MAGEGTNSRLTSVQIRLQNNQFTEEIPISVLASNIIYDPGGGNVSGGVNQGYSLVETLGNVNMNTLTGGGSLQSQIDSLRSSISSDMQNIASNQVSETVNSWLNAHYANLPETAIIDKTLTSENAAAGAKAAGDLIKVSSSQPTEQSNKIWIKPSVNSVSVPTMQDIENIIAPQYSSSSPYSIGDYVIYNDLLYRCATTIGSSGETWTSEHWTQVNIGNQLKTIPAVDSTLAVSGKAADAAKTGEELSNLKSALNPVLHSIITKGLGVPFQYSMKSGRKYRFVNTSSTGTVSCYLSVDGTANTFLAFSGLAPGGITFVTAQADYEYIRVYRGAADQTIQLYVVEGEYIDALTGAEGLGSTQYNNLGDSIRGQITKVAGLIDATNNKFEELLTGYVPLESINLFDKTQVSEIGHYWNYITGQIATADNLYAADLIVVEPETVYTITSNGIVQQGCFFDDNKNFISGYTGGNYISYEITTPQNCKYIGMSVYSGALPTYALYKGTGRTGYIPYEQLVPLRYLPKSNEITVGTNGDYTSLLQALIECDDHSVVHVKKGQYDIIEEYKAYYGETYWDDYNGYSASQNKFDRGLWLKNGVKLIFDQNAVVSFNYTGSNSKVKGNFCPIATCGNCEIEGLNLTFSGCRYAIHDDFFEYDGTEIFKNCIFNGQSNNGDTIGAGLGRSNMILIENCLFIGNASTAGGDISYHNNGYSSNSKSKVIVKDCYGENTVKFKWYGTNTEVSECIACGNRFKSITCVAHNVEPNTTVNMHLTKWNNIETDT